VSHGFHGRVKSACDLVRSKPSSSATWRLGLDGFDGRRPTRSASGGFTSAGRPLSEEPGRRCRRGYRRGREPGGLVDLCIDAQEHTTLDDSSPNFRSMSAQSHPTTKSSAAGRDQPESRPHCQIVVIVRRRERRLRRASSEPSWTERRRAPWTESRPWPLARRPFVRLSRPGAPCSSRRRRTRHHRA
jgi:hypothetical protein